MNQQSRHLKAMGKIQKERRWFPFLYKRDCKLPYHLSFITCQAQKKDFCGA